MEKEKRIELYTCRFESTVKFKSANVGIVMSAQRGSVEDVNEAMNKLAALIREMDEDASRS